MSQRSKLIMRKVNVLQKIYDLKEILFANFKNATVTKNDKVKAWEKVLKVAKANFIAGPDANWKTMRDSVFGTWKSRSLAKRSNAEVFKKKCNVIDEMIYKILYDTDPKISHNRNALNKADERTEVLEDLLSSNSKSPIPMSPPTLRSPSRSSPSKSSPSHSPAPQSPTPHIISLPSRSPVTRIHIPNLPTETHEDFDAQEKSLKLKLMEIQLHKTRLECLGLEQSLRLPPSTVTKPLFEDN